MVRRNFYGIKLDGGFLTQENMENATINLFTHPTMLTAVFVGAGVLILVYIIKLIRKDEDVVVEKIKSKTFFL